MNGTLPQCSECGTEIPYAATLCVYCGCPVGFPNVRAAEDVVEVAALRERVRAAQVSAKARNCLAELEAFGTAVSASKAVLTCNLVPLTTLVMANNNLMTTYHRMVEAGARLPENNGIDIVRGPMDAFVNPHDVYRDISYAALSLNGRGVSWYGDYSITLNGDAVERKASVFEENPYPYDVISRCGLADALKMGGKDDEAIALASETASRFPESTLALLTFGNVLREAAHLDRAAEIYGQGVERFPFSPDFLNSLAHVERLRGRYEEALAAYEEAYRKFPSDKWIESGRADILRRLGRADEAMRIYDKILARGKELRFATNAKASILIYERKYDEALHLLKLEDPRTISEWKTFLLRALLDLHTGYADAAERRLSWSLERVPFARVRRMMEATLATVQLRKGNVLQAVELTSACGEDVTALIRLHALASANQEGPARALYELLQQSFVPTQYIELREEIARTFKIVGERPRHSEGWVVEQETNALVLEAA